jgi:hypothetical protein
MAKAKAVRFLVTQADYLMAMESEESCFSEPARSIRLILVWYCSWVLRFEI